MKPIIGSTGVLPIRGIWSVPRAGRAEGNRQRYRRVFPPRGWAATVADRFANQPTLPAYAPSSPPLDAFRAAVTCLLATGPLRSLGPLDLWRVPYDTSPC